MIVALWATCFTLTERCYKAINKRIGFECKQNKTKHFLSGQKLVMPGYHCFRVSFYFLKI